MATANDHVLVEQRASEDDESRSDMAEFGEFDLSGAIRNQHTVAGYVDDEWASESEDDDDDESGSDMEFGEFDLSGARSLRDQQTFAGYEDGDDDDTDGCGAQFSMRPYRGGAIDGEMGNLLLSGFEARSDGPELTEQHELTSYDMQRLVHLALEGGESESMEDDEAYQRALTGGTPVSRVSRAAMVGQALQSANHHQQQQQSKSPTQIFPMRTGH